MPSCNRKRIGARHYQCYTKQALKEALKSMKNGTMSSREEESHFKVFRRTLFNKIKGKHSSHVDQPLTITEIEERHLDVVTASAEYGSPLTALEIRMLVEKYIDSRGAQVLLFPIDNLSSRQWVHAFLRRYSGILTNRQCHNVKEARAANIEGLIHAYFANLRTSLQVVEPQNTLNYDETNSADYPGNQKCGFRRGTKYSERYMNSTIS